MLQDTRIAICLMGGLVIALRATAERDRPTALRGDAGAMDSAGLPEWRAGKILAVASE